MERRTTEATSLLRESTHRYDRAGSRGIVRSTSCCISSKAALLALFWCFCIGIIYGLPSNPSRWILEKIGGFAPLFYFVNAISLCLYPLSGHLADNVVGTYKMVFQSVKLLMAIFLVALPTLILFLALLLYGLACQSDDLQKKSALEDAGEYGLIGVVILFYLAMNAGFIGFNANIIQFGMEQLHDSPADHQSLFIYWYVWIYYVVQLLIVQPWNILSSAQYPSYNVTHPVYHIVNDPLFEVSVSLFGVLSLVSFAMIATSLFVAVHNKNWFLINPSRINPYKLVYRITRFARKHKVPIRRSAFTYCEDEIPTGLDLAKDKYGGPYTTEEVENVKAFYGILKILLSLGPVFFLTYAADPALYWLIGEIYSSNSTFTGYSTYNYFLGDNTLSSTIVIVSIPFHLMVTRHLRCCYSINSLKTIGFGIIFLIFSLTSITVIRSFVYTDKHECFSSQQGDVCLIDDIILPVLPRCLYGISNVFLYPALNAFICAQSPSSMKGLLIGLSFAIRGIFQAMGASFALILLSNLFSKYVDLYYYGVNIVWAILSLTLYTYYARKYKYRQRDDICDVYRYAEEYYSNTQEEMNCN